LHEDSYQNFIQIHSNIHRIHINIASEKKYETSPFFSGPANRRPGQKAPRARPTEVVQQPVALGPIGQQALTWARALNVLARMGQKRPSWTPVNASRWFLSNGGPIKSPDQKPCGSP
jgi:hypothetical protein